MYISHESPEQTRERLLRVFDGAYIFRSTPSPLFPQRGPARASPSCARRRSEACWGCAVGTAAAGREHGPDLPGAGDQVRRLRQQHP